MATVLGYVVKKFQEQIRLLHCREPVLVSRLLHIIYATPLSHYRQKVFVFFYHQIE